MKLDNHKCVWSVNADSGLKENIVSLVLKCVIIVLIPIPAQNAKWDQLMKQEYVYLVLTIVQSVLMEILVPSATGASPYNKVALVRKLAKWKIVLCVILVMIPSVYCLSQASLEWKMEKSLNVPSTVLADVTLKIQPNVFHVVQDSS